MLKVFLSYSTKDKVLASNIKEGLEENGFTVFLAHEDIEPSTRGRILAELKRCNVFIPILTENFHNSEWTDQEIGIAFAYEKVIIPLKTESDPYGFIKEFQALKINTPELCKEIIKAMAATPEIRTRVKDAVIQAFCTSSSFINTVKKVALIRLLQPYSRSQINRIMKGAVSNDQIYKKLKIDRDLQNIVNRHRARIDERLLSKAKKLLRIK